MNIKFNTLLLLLFLPSALLANSVVEDLQTGWAIANYQLKGEPQEKKFKTLIEQADTSLQETPQSAEVLTWSGIIKSSFAGVEGGLAALSLIKEARDDLQKAIKIDDAALSGSAYTSLGTLYFKAPGWPISFGDDDEAERLLKKSLELNPDGIDSHYFYAEFLKDQGDYKQAKVHLLHAQNSPKRPNRPVADKGRQADISKALREVEDALN
ncbi:MAG: hypothetical protein COB62_07345 [Piscirickettsiaceae bacterium]|nr:MAG: hypothetical protein COB62_07345 [Piscirickettsiaceae bacterium]